MNQYGKDFIKILEKIKPAKHVYEVFSDWLIMVTAALYSWKKDAAAEEEYAQIAKQYKQEELDKHGQLLGITVNALEKTEEDFLGSVFTEAELTNTRNGQFFTPYNVTLMMAKMIFGENELPLGRVCKVNDPTCGAGGMLIAGAMVMKERGFDFQNNALFIGQDIDPRCARMAFIQLSLLGVPAIIYCMNTLTFQEYWHRETIGYHMAGMEWRLRTEALFEKIKDISQPMETVETTEKKVSVDIILPRRELVQGELF
jgi:type I restriction-modification system DNA methylase subunit